MGQIIFFISTGNLWIDERFELNGGAFGLAAQIASAGDDVMLEFDDFELRLPPDTGLPTSRPMPLTPLRQLPRAPARRHGRVKIDL